MKWGRVGTALFGVLTMVVATSAPAFGGAPLPNGSGTVAGCPVTGSIQFKPALVNGGTDPVTIKIKLKSAKGTSCTPGTGDGANVATVQVGGSAIFPINDCAIFSSSEIPVSLAETAKWKMTKGATPKKIANSIAGVQALSIQPLGAVLPNVKHYQIATESLEAPINFGSFTGTQAEQALITDQTVSDVAAACAGKGLKKLTIGSKANPADSFKGLGRLRSSMTSLRLGRR